MHTCFVDFNLQDSDQSNAGGSGHPHLARSHLPLPPNPLSSLACVRAPISVNSSRCDSGCMSQPLPPSAITPWKEGVSSRPLHGHHGGEVGAVFLSKKFDGRLLFASLLMEDVWVSGSLVWFASHPDPQICVLCGACNIVLFCVLIRGALSQNLKSSCLVFCSTVCSFVLLFYCPLPLTAVPGPLLFSIPFILHLNLTEASHIVGVVAQSHHSRVSQCDGPRIRPPSCRVINIGSTESYCP